MSRPSPSTRRSQLLSSPDRHRLSDFFSENRNSELSHRDALAAAQAEHERVREAALRVYHLHEMKEEHNRIVEAEKKEQERLRVEAQIAAEEQRLQELRAKSIPKPKPPPPPPPSEPVRQAESEAAATPPPAKTTTTSQPEPARTSLPPQPAQPPPQDSQAKAPPAQPAPQPNGLSGLFGQPAKPGHSLFGAQPKEAPKTTPTPNGIAPSQPAQPPAQAQPTTAAPGGQSQADLRLLQIHKQLKKLRTDLQAQARVPGSPLKGQMGNFRREIRVSIGQLTSGKGANAQPINKITTTLRAALDGSVPSPPIDVGQYVVDSRQPADGATYNDATMPSLFIYLINICAKAVINQFISEGGANPKAADPIGVFTAHIFSMKEFHWRGQTLIDILIAKFRVVCPVLFGSRGNDKMERGRLALGWKKDGPSWITEQSHNDRMTGLGAGYASISLRDFSKSSKTNPYPPVQYWKALSKIVNTPAGETSNTQYIVLRSMIQGHEERFITFYGQIAVAALQLALVEFPKKAPATAMASGSLSALAEVLRNEQGLQL